MTGATLPPPRERAISALDPGLSFLASQAAVELDNLLLDGSGNLEAVRQLGRQLQKSMEHGPQTGERGMFLDAPTVSVLSDAISQASRPVKSLTDLVSEAWQMAEDLQGTEPSERGGLERLRSFCLFLSQNARAYRQSIFEMYLSLTRNL